MPKTKFRLMSTMLLAFLIASGLPLNPIGNTAWQQDAMARSSAGRTGGGSFKRSAPARSTSPSNSNTPTRSNNSPSNFNQPNRTNNTNIVPIVIPGSQPNYGNNNYSGGNRSSNDDGSWIFGLIVIVLLLGGAGAVVYFIWQAINKSGSGVAGNELENETVTVSKLQVALLAEAREVQSKLNQISLQADTDTPEGLSVLLQESVLALLRTPENWTHVQSSSQAVHRDRAEEVFNRLSIEERSKFSAETLVNVNGRSIGQQSYKPDPDEDPAAYIVVTLLIGTENDKPLFGDIKSREALEAALQKLAGVNSSNLLTFELMWSPQTEADSLTYDELLTEYSNMIQI